MTLRTRPPRPFRALTHPTYPRVLAVATLLVAGCGAIANEQRPSEPDPGGVVALPFDTGIETGEDTGRDAGSDTKIEDATDAREAEAPPPDTGEPMSAGNAAYPFDADEESGDR